MNSLYTMANEFTLHSERERIKTTLHYTKRILVSTPGFGLTLVRVHSHQLCIRSHPKNGAIELYQFASQIILHPVSPSIPKIRVHWNLNSRFISIQVTEYTLKGTGQHESQQDHYWPFLRRLVHALRFAQREFEICKSCSKHCTAPTVNMPFSAGQWR